MCDNVAMNTERPLKVFGQHDEGTIQQIQNCLNIGGVAAVLCADGHKGYAQPIGGVVAYKNCISISGVGYDIACGNMAIRTDANPLNIQTNIAKIMTQVRNKISFGVGRVNNEPVDHELFQDPLWNEKPFSDWKDLAYNQLGTVGSGNHYVDIFIDEQKQVWVGVHFGSRGLGHKTATHFLNMAGGKDGMDVAPTLVKLDTYVGQAYKAGMDLAGRYAYAGREYVARRVVKEILGANVRVITSRQFKHFRGSLRRMYGMSFEQYVKMFNNQSGSCKICGIKPNDKPLFVDHCHNSKRVRGLLCSKCNLMIGYANDLHNWIHGSVSCEFCKVWRMCEAGAKRQLLWRLGVEG